MSILTFLFNCLLIITHHHQTYYQVRTVTREQVKLLRVAVHDDSGTNARPQQPINLRTVKLYRPDDENQNP